MDRFTETNLRNWEDRVPIHLQSYPLDKFKAGWDPLFPIEAAELGDVQGLKVLHLQCHIGLDSLGLARRGADVTGVDFSPSAIQAARDLAEDTGLAATFVEGDVYDTPELIDDEFDLVYTTWGTTGWLPDINRWAEVVRAMLAPGGRLYHADGHPGLFVFEEEDDRLVHTYPWRTEPGDPLLFEEDVTYTGDKTPLKHKECYDWVHPLSSVIGGLIDAGLSIDFLHEHETIPWAYVTFLEPDPDEPRLFRMPADQPQLPLSFSLGASKPN